MRGPKDEAIAKTIVFDVNETLLDLSALDPLFERAFGDAIVRRLWFARVLQSAFVSTIAGPYSDFGAIADDALDVVARLRGTELGTDDRSAILKALLSLPAHSDVAEGLGMLKGAGMRLVTLTNSTQKAVQAQLGSAGLLDYFDKAITVDDVRTFKPDARVYRHAEEVLGVGPGELMLVAAHDWDIAGAIAAGWSGAYVARPGMGVGALTPSPQITGADLVDVAGKILVADG